MTELLDRMVAARSAWTSGVVRSWYSADQLGRQLRASLCDEAGRVGDAGFGRGFRDAVARPGMPTDPLGWANRLVDLPDGGWAVTHLRFRLGDPAMPFVDVVATSAPPSPDGLAEVATTVLHAYRRFSPLCVRVEAPDGAGLLAALEDDARFGRCAAHLHVVAGRVEELRTHPRATSHPAVRLSPLDPGLAAARVASVYARLADVLPQSTAWAAPEDAASLAEYAATGLLFAVLVDGRPAGVTAAARDDDHGMTGFTVTELCLDARHRGRRLGAATLQHLVDELPARDDDVLWGTIHPGNRPSLRTALSVGRTTTSSLLWVSPATAPGMPVAVTR